MNIFDAKKIGNYHQEGSKQIYQQKNLILSII